MADFRVLWTDAAQSDLHEIAQFIAAESLDNALAVIDRLERRCSTLERLPERGRIVPELKAVDILIYRELIVKPWRIVYRRDANQVYVMAVLDGRRSLSGLLLERLTLRSQESPL
ncbi:MAG: type II toxin-antitoxin system RelE/ParE family toxin [Gammaproteobacteria bacterium]|nr:type II toxin-antitoxin system RelE/ParE family toxin [Gammaproteobacteria bacterium]MDE0366129.1 type II toxin-antitoxin system RelE/ParE family toxin [Gammaproteobacteria bacterium]